MKPSTLTIAGLDTTADYGRWDPDDFTPCESPLSTVESALKTPSDEDAFHAPLWASQRERQMERQMSQERLDSSARKLGYLGSSNQSVHEPFAILGSREPYYLGLKSPGAYQQFLDVGSSPSRNAATHGASDYGSNPRFGRFRAEDEYIPPVPPLSVKAKGRTLSKLPVATRTPAPKAPAVKLTSPQIDARPNPRSSTLTFAAIWDPESGGMTTVSGTGLLRNNSTRSTRPVLSRAPHTAPAAQKYSGVKLTGHTKGSSLPTSPKAFLRPNRPMRSASEGDKRFAEPADYAPLSSTPESTARKAFAEFDDGNKSANRNFSVIDEGFFENAALFSPPVAFDTANLAGHDDCDPHLMSRFSTSTTSTSNYIDIDFPPERSAREFALNAMANHSKTKKKTGVSGGLGMSFDSVSTPNLGDRSRGAKSPPPSAFPRRVDSPPNTPSDKSRQHKRPSFLGKLTKRGSKPDKGWVSVEVMTILKEDSE